MLGLKGNQSKLHEAVEDFFVTAQANNFKNTHDDYEEEIDKGHGRLEARRYWISDALQSLPDTQQWKGLRSIGMVERECLKGDVQSLVSSVAISLTHFLRRLNRSQQRYEDIGVLKTHCIGDWMLFWAMMLAELKEMRLQL